MVVGMRVKHSKYGSGTIKYVMFENIAHKLYVVEFDVSNSELYDCLGISKLYKGRFCNADELEVIENERYDY